MNSKQPDSTVVQPLFVVEECCHGRLGSIGLEDTVHLVDDDARTLFTLAAGCIVMSDLLTNALWQCGGAGMYGSAVQGHSSYTGTLQLDTKGRGGHRRQHGPSI